MVERWRSGWINSLLAVQLLGLALGPKDIPGSPLPVNWTPQVSLPDLCWLPDSLPQPELGIPAPNPPPAPPPPPLCSSGREKGEVQDLEAGELGSQHWNWSRVGRWQPALWLSWFLPGAGGAWRSFTVPSNSPIYESMENISNVISVCTPTYLTCTLINAILQIIRPSVMLSRFRLPIKTINSNSRSSCFLNRSFSR